VETQSKQPMKKTLLVFALACTAHAAPPEIFWNALHQVESGGRHGRILGDYVNGQPQALGPLQITRAFFSDASVPGAYHQVQDLAYARRVATAYYMRYAPEAYRQGNMEVLARIHNGGPMGHRKASTLAYSRRLLAYTRR
jgi:hypothetical protein